MLLKEGAACLSAMLSEDISEQDLLELAVQKALTLSIVIPTSFSAIQYEQVSLDEADVVVYPTQVSDDDEPMPELVSKAEAVRRNLTYKFMDSVAAGAAFKYSNLDVRLPAGVYDIHDIGLGRNLLAQRLEQIDKHYPVLEEEFRHLLIRDEEGNLFEVTEIKDIGIELPFPSEDFPSGSRLAIRPEHLQSLERKITKTPRVADDEDYVAGQLLLLERASWEFWYSADRDDRTTYPGNQEVTDWLIQQGFSENLAKAGASIIRPKWAKLG
jgi:hypothetical protein